MEVVLVGLPGSGKTEVGRRLAEAIGAELVDVDAQIERRAGRPIAEIFRVDGEPTFRAMERQVVTDLGSPGARPRVIAPGGGCVVDPRNRWALYRSRRVAWLDASTAVLADRLRRSSVVRPLLAGGDLEAGLGVLRLDRARFYAAGTRFDASGPIADTVAAIATWLADSPADHGTPLFRAELPTGRLLLGPDLAAAAIADELRQAGAQRAVVLTEPRAWGAIGNGIREGLVQRGWTVEVVELPEGEPAKRLAVVEWAANELAHLALERSEPIVAVGGGALTDVAGFVAATFGRGVPWIAVPTTLLGQLDAAIGGKTAVDIDAGKNLVGAFHLPLAVIVDPTLLATLPERHRRAALAEAVKDGVLGDPRLLDVLERDGPGVAVGEAAAEMALGEIVERAAWVKIGFVERDPDEHGDRIALNLGHTIGHAIEAEAGFGPVLHGEAVAYGLRAACRIGTALDVTPRDRAERIEALLDALDLGSAPLDLDPVAVVRRVATDKKRHGRATRWVLPTADGWTVRDDVPNELVAPVARGVLVGRAATVPA